MVEALTIVLAMGVTRGWRSALIGAVAATVALAAIVAALVTVDPEQVDGDVQAEVQRAIDAVNDGRSRYEQIKRFRVLPRDFSLEEDELTPTLKMRRKVILEHFAADVDALYKVSDT